MPPARRRTAMDTATQRKWDKASRTLDLFAFAEDRRLGPHKRRLFSKMSGATLMVAAGTGNDFKFFPPSMNVVAIDISPKMLERAALKAATYTGSIELREMDVCALEFAGATFDTVVTACTFCSVPKPIVGLRELRRVLKPNGQILMFEHVRSAIGPLGILMDLMTPLVSRFGPDLNRDTVGNVQKAGFRLRRVENVYLDVVKIIEAVKEA
ncbi:MAG: methyltransferase domain-containing protein [Rhodospirillales bacterium]|nr:methyltransferase domain-containing protein [Rhodospirillales bacterium]